MYNPAFLVVTGGAWMGSCIAERGLSRGHYWLLNLGRALPNWSSEIKRDYPPPFSKKIKINKMKEKTQNAFFKTPNPPYTTHDAQPMNIEQISLNTRFLLVSLPNNEMLFKSPFAIQKALLGIGGEPKSVKRLRSGDLLIETTSALQTKSFLLTKSFLNNPVTISPHIKA
ncbi:hypothetical protein TNCV_4916741 [Trichonephila clavipes]|nr:hypothetical protein TNCV_4916741 [Trichonephila clavipes]